MGMDTGLVRNACRRMNVQPGRFYQRQRQNYIETKPLSLRLTKFYFRKPFFF